MHRYFSASEEDSEEERERIARRNARRRADEAVMVIQPREETPEDIRRAAVLAASQRARRPRQARQAARAAYDAAQRAEFSELIATMGGENDATVSIARESARRARQEAIEARQEAIRARAAYDASQRARLNDVAPIAAPIATPVQLIQPPTGNLPLRNIPRGSENIVSKEEIQEGNIMTNIHGEYNHGHYYKWNSIAAPRIKRNPLTRQPILNTDRVYYRAHIVDTEQDNSPQPQTGGRRRRHKSKSFKRKSRKQRKNRKTHRRRR